MSYTIPTYRIANRITGSAVHNVPVDEIADTLMLTRWFDVEALECIDALITLEHDLGADLCVCDITAYLAITVVRDGTHTIYTD